MYLPYCQSQIFLFLSGQSLCSFWATFYFMLLSLCVRFFYLSSFSKKKKNCRASLVAQWLRICLPMQGTWVRVLLREDPTCCGATKPVRHNYWACTLEPASHNYWARMPQLLKPARLESVLCNKRSHPMRSPRSAMKSSPRSPQLEKSLHAATKTERSQT